MLSNESYFLFACSRDPHEAAVETNRDTVCQPDADVVPSPAVDAASLSSAEFASLADSGGEESGDRVVTDPATTLAVFDLDACVEAQRAVFAMHRTITMQRMNRSRVGGQKFLSSHNQSSTLAVPIGGNFTDDRPRSIYHGGSLNALPISEDSFEDPSATTLFEQVIYNLYR